MRAATPQRVILVASLVGLIGLVGPPTARAQDCVDRDLFLFEMELFVSDLEVVEGQLDDLGLEAHAHLGASIELLTEAIETSTDEELVGLCERFHANPVVPESAQRLSEALELVPPQETPMICLSREQYLAVFITKEILKGVALGLQAACDASQGTPIACKILCPIAAVANGLQAGAEFVLDEDDLCTFVTHFATIEDFFNDTLVPNFEFITETQEANLDLLDDLLSTRATQLSLDLLRADLLTGEEFDLANLQARINAAEAQLAEQGAERMEFRDNSLRLRVEESLRAGQEGRIVSYQIPEDLGGKLETVREVTAETVVDNLAVFNDVGVALDCFQIADTLFTNNDYQDAYTCYRVAYREAVQPGLALCKLGAMTCTFGESK